MCWTSGGFHMKECPNKGKTSTSKLPTCWNIEKCEHYGVLTNILIIKMVKKNEDMKEATISQTRSMTKAKVVVWPLNKIHFLGLRNFTSTLATSQKLEENKVTRQHSTNVPTYPKSNSILGFFCGSRFVDSIDVPHDAHVLQAKHLVTFYYPIELDSSTIITFSNSHTLEPWGVNEGFDLQSVFSPIIYVG